MTDELKFEKLNKKELEILVKWADEEGWNPGPNDADVYWETDPEGYYGYFYNNELIAGGSIVSYSGEFGFMGFFIVKPEYRAQGIGRKLWYQRRDKMLERLIKGAPIGMDGVVDMQPFYNKGGFKIAYRDERHEIVGKEYKINSNISVITDDDFDIVMDYDRKCFGYSRPQFMKPWIKLPNTNAFKYLEDNKLKGFTVIRKANTGYKICPLFADNELIAEKLLQAALNSVNGESLFIDIPVINKKAVELIEKYASKYVFECARMYYGTPPNIDINNIFGMTTFELG